MRRSAACGIPPGGLDKWLDAALDSRARESIVTTRSPPVSNPPPQAHDTQNIGGRLAYAVNLNLLPEIEGERVVRRLLGRRWKAHGAPDVGLDGRVGRQLGAVARALGALRRTRARRLVLPGPDAVALDLAVGAEAKRVRRVGSSWDRAQRRSTSQSGLTSRTYVWTSRTASRAVLPATRAMRGRTWRS